MNRSFGRRRGFAAAIVAAMAVVIATFGQAGPASAVASHTVTVTVTGSDPSGIGDLTVELSGDNSAYDSFQQTSTAGTAVFRDVPDDAVTAFVFDGRPNAAYSFGSGFATVSGADASIAVPLTAQFHCTGASNTFGAYVVGSTLTAQPPGWANGTPTSVSYTWYRLTVTNAKVRYTIVASQSPTYTLTADDAGHQIEVDVEYIGATDDAICDYNATPVISFPNTPAPARPGVAGKARVGKRLVAIAGTVTPGTTVAYQWFRTKVVKKGHRVVVAAISGATGVAYQLKKKDRGTTVSVAVTYSRPGYNPTTVLSRGRRVR